jgi:hypothetical protein
MRKKFLGAYASMLLNMAKIANVDACDLMLLRGK